MKLRFFGHLRALAGDEREVELPPHVTDSALLREWLGRETPALLDPGVKIALDDRILVTPAPLGGAREVAFLPPLSGG